MSVDEVAAQYINQGDTVYWLGQWRRVASAGRIGQYNRRRLDLIVLTFSGDLEAGLRPGAVILRKRI